MGLPYHDAAGFSYDVPPRDTLFGHWTNAGNFVSLSRLPAQPAPAALCLRCLLIMYNHGR